MVCRGTNSANSGADDDASFNFCEPCHQALHLRGHSTTIDASRCTRSRRRHWHEGVGCSKMLQ